MEFTAKGFLTFAGYGLIIGIISYIGYWSTAKVARLGSEVGAILGGLVGAILIVLAWVFFGKKFVSGKESSYLD